MKKDTDNLTREQRIALWRSQMLHGKGVHITDHQGGSLFLFWMPERMIAGTPGRNRRLLVTHMPKEPCSGGVIRVNPAQPPRPFKMVARGFDVVTAVAVSKLIEDIFSQGNNEKFDIGQLALPVCRRDASQVAEQQEIETETEVEQPYGQERQVGQEEEERIGWTKESAHYWLRHCEDCEGSSAKTEGRCKGKERLWGQNLSVFRAER